MDRERKLIFFFCFFSLQAGAMMGCGGGNNELTLDLGNMVTMKLVLIPAGKFMMGSPTQEKGRIDKEGPKHEVIITKPFFMAIYPVTQSQYERITGRNPSFFIGVQNPDDPTSFFGGQNIFRAAKSPVEQVSWRDAAEFCKKLSRKTGKTVRLPTEAEWEYACRAGSTTLFYYGNDDDGAKLGDYAWYSKNCQDIMHPVGRKKPNGWGLYDMNGNVWQWCADWDGPYEGLTQTNPSGPVTGTDRILRGGGWRCEPYGCRSAFRYSLHPGDSSWDVGFRVVVSLE